MKTTAFIILISFLSSCKLLKQKEKSRYTLESVATQHHTSRSKGELETNIQFSSDAKSQQKHWVLIESDGPYVWHPDSGLKGNKGRLKLQYQGASNVANKGSILVNQQSNNEQVIKQKVNSSTKQQLSVKKEGLKYLPKIWTFIFFILVVVVLIYVYRRFKIYFS